MDKRIKKIIIIPVIAILIILLVLFLAGCILPAGPGTQSGSDELKEPELTIPDRVLDDEDIRAEAQKLQKINKFPANRKIDRDDYPKALGTYSENGLVLVERYSFSEFGRPETAKVELMFLNVSERMCDELEGRHLVNYGLWASTYYGCAPWITSIVEWGACDERRDENARNQCYASFGTATADTSICTTKITSPYYIDSCFEGIARRKVNLSMCNLIQDARLKEFCLASIAGVKGGLSVCNSLQDVSLRDGCLSKIAELNKDPDTCDLMQEGKDWCYLTVGRQAQDISACAKIQSESLRKSCYTLIAQSAKNLSICEEYVNGSCYSEMAYYTRNLSMCDLEKDQRAKRFCYNSVAYSTGNVTICETFNNQSWTDLCYFDVANNKNIVSVCDKIIGKKLKDSCYEEAKEKEPTY